MPKCEENNNDTANGSTNVIFP